MTTTETITNAQIVALRAEAIDGEDSQHDPDCLDEDGRPDYSGGGHKPSELREIRTALRLTRGEARQACARAIASAEAQS